MEMMVRRKEKNEEVKREDTDEEASTAKKNYCGPITAPSKVARHCGRRTNIRWALLLSSMLDVQHVLGIDCLELRLCYGQSYNAPVAMAVDEMGRRRHVSQRHDTK